MQKKFIWVVASGLVVVSMLLAACAPAATTSTTPTAPVTPTAPAVKEAAPAVKEATPAVKEAAPAEKKDTIPVTLKKLDGTVVERLVEKPRYGGTLINCSQVPVLAFDEAYQSPWSTAMNLTPTNENLIWTDWTRGPCGTREVKSRSEYFTPAHIVGQLAESWEVAAPDTLIFHIRKGVHYGLNPKSEASRLVNGREFTADDAVFNLKRIYFDITTSTMYGMASDSRPTEVYATDKYTLVVKGPSATLGKTLDDAVGLTKMVPPEVVKKYGDMNQWENVVGTGPFFLVDYVPMSSVTWVRNPNHWLKDPFFPENQLPYLDSYKLLIIPDWSTRMAALRTSKIDMDGGFNLEDFQQIIKFNPNLKYLRVDPATCFPWGFRVDKPELPFKDIRVRRALLMAVDNQKILDTYYKGDGVVVNYKVPPVTEFKDMGWYTPLEELPPSTKELFTYNPEKAKQLLTEAGYPNGFKTEVVFPPIYAGGDYMDIAIMVKEYWSKIGVDVTLDLKEYGTFMSIYQRKTHKEMMFCARGGKVDSMYLCLPGNMYNWTMIDDPRNVQYFNEITSAYFDTPRKNKLMKEMNLYVLSQAWYYTPPIPFRYTLWQPWVKNYEGLGSLGIYVSGNQIPYMWIDQELKKAMGY